MKRKDGEVLENDNQKSSRLENLFDLNDIILALP